MRLRVRREFADDGAVFDDPRLEVGVFRRIDVADAAALDGDGFSAVFDAGGVIGRIGINDKAIDIIIAIS